MSAPSFASPHTRSHERKAHASGGLKLLAMLGLVMVLSACAANNNRREELAYVERPVERLYTDALVSIDRRQWARAALQFDEVERQHPFSEWARRAMLMSAYAHYESSRYDEAVTAARRYIDFSPSSPSASYAYYLIGLCYFEQILDVGRDQRITELALDGLGEVVRRYPGTDYARDAQLKIDMVRDQLAGKEMEVGRFYLRRDEHLAAILRFETVVRDYQTTTHAPEALFRLVEAYLSLGLMGEAERTASVLAYNYPNNVWARDGAALVNADLPSQRGLALATTDPQELEDENANRGFFGWFTDRF
jgi:outer membrane protein assembly factor BamD